MVGRAGGGRIQAQVRQRLRSEALADLGILLVAVIVGSLGVAEWESVSPEEIPPPTAAELATAHRHGGVLLALAAMFVLCVVIRARRWWVSALGVVPVVLGLLTLLPALLALEYGQVGVALGTVAIALGLVLAGYYMLRGRKVPPASEA